MGFCKKSWIEMDSRKQVSIIVPVYNAAWNLDKCITSLIKQTYTDIEIILINDGSKDDSLKICLRYAAKDERIIVINKPNSGVSDTRNLGILKASGRYISFVDSDDWVNETYIENFHIENITVDKFVVIQGIVYDVAKRDVRNIMFEYPSLKLSIPENVKEIKKYSIFNNGCPVAKLFSKRVIIENNLLFNSKLSLNEDHVFVLDYYACVDSIFLCNSINYHYYYDYKLPSLTKINHLSSEYIDIAHFIKDSFERLISKFNMPVDYWRDSYTLFGPIQLMKASMAVFVEKDSFNKFKKIVNTWRQLKIQSELLTVNDIYTKSFIQIVDRYNIYILFSTQYALFQIQQIRNRIKYFVKKFLLRY